jgi:hypothetical protein
MLTLEYRITIVKNYITFLHPDFTIIEFNFPILMMRCIWLKIIDGTDMMNFSGLELKFRAKMTIIK